MLRILYISTARVDFGEAAFNALVQAAAARNRAGGITGLLLFNGRNFMQLLEGENGRLVDMMARLRADPRHDGIKIISQARIDAWACGSWGMQRLWSDAGNKERRAELGYTLPSALPAELRDLMLGFAGLD